MEVWGRIVFPERVGIFIPDYFYQLKISGYSGRVKVLPPEAVDVLTETDFAGSDVHVPQFI